MPQFSAEFPAQPVQTALAPSDPVLNPAITQQLRVIENSIGQNDAASRTQAVSAPAKPGYRVLFDGPPSAAKAQAAALLGKQTGREVVRVDVSQVVANYIGETEKNLSALFDRAEKGNWILFFDEADALFSKRTTVSDAHDKYANQEAAFLLQRIESYAGVVILATNARADIDEAFLRRCQSVIAFHSPVA